MKTLTRWSLLITFALVAPGLVVSCSRENGTKQHNQNEVSQTDMDNIGVMATPIVNGLSMELSLADVEKRWVRVIWKNMQDTELILTSNASIASQEGNTLVWPYFEYRKKLVPHWMPTALFIGWVEYGGKRFELIDVLQYNEKPLFENEYPIEKLSHIILAPGQEHEVIFDLGSLFEGISDTEVDAAKVWFGYECMGGEHEGDRYWRGSMDSNILEIKR